MRYLKKFESFSEYDDEPLTRTEEIFGKKTRLEKQFSNIVADGLIGEDDIYWSTFNALKIEVKKVVDKVTYKELQHRVVEGENPTEVMIDICSRVDNNKEMQRLLKKLKNI